MNSLAPHFNHCAIIYDGAFPCGIDAVRTREGVFSIGISVSPRGNWPIGEKLSLPQISQWDNILQKPSMVALPPVRTMESV